MLLSVNRGQSGKQKFYISKLYEKNKIKYIYYIILKESSDYVILYSSVNCNIEQYWMSFLS